MYCKRTFPRSPLSGGEDFALKPGRFPSVMTLQEGWLLGWGPSSYRVALAPCWLLTQALLLFFFFNFLFFFLILKSLILSSSYDSSRQTLYWTELYKEKPQVTPAPSEMSSRAAKLLLTGPCSASASTPTPSPHLSSTFSPTVRLQPAGESECIHPTPRSVTLGSWTQLLKHFQI